jgi:DNA mismatch endonuclease (patch repair protein)
MVLPKYRMAVFVHGCFWHQHGCPKSKRPSSNREFWDRKLDANVERDARNLDELDKIGWISFTVWECTLERDTDDLLDTLRGVRAGLGLGLGWPGD